MTYGHAIHLRLHNERPRWRGFDSGSRRRLSYSPTMTVSGIGSRTSPIIIDDDDDDVPPPSRPKVNANSSTSPAEAPPQESILAGSIEARKPTSARQGPPDQLRNGIGYSILVRMGYKPGYGLGVNLEGIRSLTTILLGG